MLHSLSRDLRGLAARRFDVLVVGGGIYGLTVACDAAQRGLDVALIERNDFGSGSSFNHLRTIHGGLRYLQTLDFGRARQSVRERRAIARVAPWSVRPLPFVLPLYRSLTRGKAAMRVGFLLDRLVASDRNDLLPECLHLPYGRVIGRNEAERKYPELQGLHIAGAAVWHDYVTLDADRLTLSWALAAADRGTSLANYVEARMLTTAAGRVSGAVAVDRLAGDEFRISARTVVNATGGAVNHLLRPFHADIALPLLQAMNLVTSRPAPAAAIGGRSGSGRNLFLVPWQGRALFGTWESSSTREPGDLVVRDGDLSAFLTELNQAFPSYHLTRDDVTLVHRGVVPARLNTGPLPALESREQVHEHRAEGLAGTISVAGTKYTTARAVAERIVDRLFALLNCPRRACASDSIPLPQVTLAGDDLLRYVAANEMVMTLADAVMRRTSLGALGCPDDTTLAHAALVVGDVLGWSADRRRDEVASVRLMY